MIAATSYGYPGEQRYIWSRILIPLLLVTLACDGGSHLQGRVRDAAGNPVAGAHIVLSAEGYSSRETASRSDGTYSADMIHAPSNDVALTLTADKPGYQKYERHLTSGDAMKEATIDIVLLPRPSFPAGGMIPNVATPPN